MEFFFNPVTGRVEQRQVNNNLPFRSMTELDSEINQFPFLPSSPTVPLDAFKNTVAPVPPFNPQSFQNLFPTKGIMSQAPKSLGFDTSFGVANEEDEEQEFLPDQKKSSGIADLFRTLLGFAVPGLGLLTGGFDGIRSLNQRLRNTDFGRSKNLMDFIDMKKYGGYQGREDARAATMAQARGAQKKIDRGDFGGSNISIDRGRGSIPSRSSPSPSKSRSSGGYGGGRDRGRGDRF